MNWTNAVILYKFPSRERPEKFRQAIKSILDNSNQQDKIRFIISLDSNDPTLSDYHKVIDETLAKSKCQYDTFEGESKNKIDAVNRDLQHAKDFDIIICMSDDMRFIEKGFDDIIRNEFARCFPLGDGCLHFPDQLQGANCMTLNITDRIYFERFRYIYDPSYVTVECDLENQEVAQMINKYRFIERYGMLKHLHPSFGQAEYDALYNRTESFELHNQDKQTRRNRKANHYYLIKTETGWIHPNDKPKTMSTTEPQSVEQRLNDLSKATQTTAKKREKLLKKVAECNLLAAEIEQLGIMKISINVTEESVK